MILNWARTCVLKVVEEDVLDENEEKEGDEDEDEDGEKVEEEVLESSWNFLDYHDQLYFPWVPPLDYQYQWYMQKTD